MDLTMRTQESEPSPAGLQQEVVDLCSSAGGRGDMARAHVRTRAAGYYTL
jgi:hypothetical protein